MTERVDLTPQVDKVDCLASIPLFTNMETPALHQLAENMEVMHLCPGEVLMQQGDRNAFLFIIWDGRVCVMTQNDLNQNVVLAELSNACSVGELSMWTGSPCMETVYTLCSTWVLRLSKTDYDDFVARFPASRPSIEQALTRSLQKAQLRYALYVQQVFAHLDSSVLPDVEQELELFALSSGAVLIQQNTSSDALYVILNGWLRVVVTQPDGSDKTVTELGRGQCAGEMGVLTGEARNASVYAVRDTLLAKLTKAGFERLLQKHPQAIMRQFTAPAVKKLLYEARGFTTPPSRGNTIALVALDRNVPLTALAQRLVRAMATQDNTLHLTATSLEQSLARPGMAQTQEDVLDNLLLLPWLNEREMRYPYVLYEADDIYCPDASPWTQRCLRQADHIVWVAWSSASPPPFAFSDCERREMPSQSLVLLHPETCTQPTGTSMWLDQIPVDWHHHLRWDHTQDLNRLARRLMGRAVGLVLSSGAARGIAHLGVLRAIEELGIEIDVIGGTSIGAVIGANYALGVDSATLYQQAQQLIVPSTLLDYTLPFVSFFAGKKITNVLKTLFRDLCIEDAWRPFFCVSTNFSENAEVIHRRGMLWEALRASSSVPLGLPPVKQQGHLLVDGALLNPLPADVMHQYCMGGPVIGVDANQSRDFTQIDAYGPSLSGWKILWHRCSPFRKRLEVPSIWTIMMRSVDLASQHRHHHHQQLLDVHISPPVSQVGLSDLSVFDELVELGYQSAMPQLEDWLTSQYGWRDPIAPHSFQPSNLALISIE